MVSRRLAVALSRREYTRPQQSLLPVTQSDPFRCGRIDRYRIDGPSHSRETGQSIDADAENSEKQRSAAVEEHEEASEAEQLGAAVR